MQARNLLALTVLALALPLAACGSKPNAEAGATDAATEAAPAGEPAADANIETAPAVPDGAVPEGTEAGTDGQN